MPKQWRIRKRGFPARWWGDHGWWTLLLSRAKHYQSEKEAKTQADAVHGEVVPVTKPDDYRDD